MKEFIKKNKLTVLLSTIALLWIISIFSVIHEEQEKMFSITNLDTNIRYQNVKIISKRDGCITFIDTLGNEIRLCGKIQVELEQ